MNPYLVVNPTSGGGRTGKTFPEMRKAIERALGTCEVGETTRAGHAVDLARAAAEKGHELVIAVGGDGTFSDVVDGVLRAGNAGTEVALIGQGTGGDFRKTLELEHRLDGYLAAITSGKKRGLDVGRFRYQTRAGETRDRHFVNILSCGLGGLVDQYVAGASRMLGGTAAYFGASVRGLLAVQKGRLRCELSLAGKAETHVVHTYVLAICNGRFFGAGMHVAPMADPSDGVFEIIALESTSKLAFALTSGRIYSAKHMATATHLRCDKVRVTLENDDAGPFLLDVDGEPLGTLPIDVELVRSAVTLRG